MIFSFNNYWWLITTFSNTGHNPDSELQIFYSEKGPLTNSWISFKKNPVFIGGTFTVEKIFFPLSQSAQP